MRILLVGAGGVGSAAVGIAARRGFFDAMRRGRLRPDAGRARRRAAADDRGSRAARVDASSAADGHRPVPRRTDHPRAQRGRPAVRHADLRRRVRRRRRLPRHGDVAVAAAPDPALRGDRRQARRRAVRRRRRPGQRPRPARAGRASASSRACPTCSPATPPTTCSTAIDEIGVRDGANLVVDGYDFAPSFSIWTTIEECLNPPVIWEEDRGWYTTEPFSEPEVFDFPDGHRPGRVRQRRARGGAADPALGARPAGSRSSTASGDGVHRRAADPAQARAGLAPARSASVAVEVAPRDVVAACLPDPADARRPDARQDLRRDLGARHGQGRQPREVYLYHVVDNEWSMREYGSQAVVWQTAINPVVALELLADGAWTGRRRARAGGVRPVAVPRPADRVRLAVGDARTVTWCLGIHRSRYLTVGNGLPVAGQLRSG